MYVYIKSAGQGPLPTMWALQAICFTASVRLRSHLQLWQARELALTLAPTDGAMLRQSQTHKIVLNPVVVLHNSRAWIGLANGTDDAQISYKETNQYNVNGSFRAFDTRERSILGVDEGYGFPVSVKVMGHGTGRDGQTRYLEVWIILGSN